MITDEHVNPFQELYVSETTVPREYVELFSPVLVPHALELFQKGNVVLKGTQGCGKTMLLNLLKPEVRIAYFDNSGDDFPIPLRLRKFLGAGINIRTSAILDLGQRRIADDDKRMYPLYFADFFNYWIVEDMLASLRKMVSRVDVFGGLVREDRLQTFVEQLRVQDCWFGYLQGIDSFDELATSISSRITSYRSFHNENAPLPVEVSESKTSIGEPIARTAQVMRSSGLLHPNALVLIRIDQLEELTRGDFVRQGLGHLYRQVINKAISPRDPRIFYRVGTRPYAWDDELAVYGTANRLELHRDYQVTDVDEMLRRRENAKDWRFPAFADDTFRRRLRHTGIPFDEEDNPMRNAFARTRTPAEAATYYVGKSAFEKVFDLDKRDWHAGWEKLLRALYPAKVLEAKLAYAWALQTGGKSEEPSRYAEAPPKTKPWETRKWWRKERIRQALMQLAGRCGQRLEWSGAEAVYALSTGNILSFLRICQGVWEIQARANRSDSQNKIVNFLTDGFEYTPQARGIEAASGAWFDKIIESTDKGTDQQRFVAQLGRIFYSALYADEAMSYPGYNGFSLIIDDLAKWPELERFLQSMIDWGTLVESPHTTKHRDRRKRRKWYLHPILSPYFKIPEAHAKEPMYVGLEHIAAWLEKARAFVPGGPRATGTSNPQKDINNTMPLFEGLIANDDAR